LTNPVHKQTERQTDRHQKIAVHVTCKSNGANYCFYTPAINTAIHLDYVGCTLAQLGLTLTGSKCHNWDKLPLNRLCHVCKIWFLLFFVTSITT